MSPTVSVIIPVFNRERFLPAAIDSVLAQTFTDFELIVVDDGSTDGTAAVIAAVGDRRLRGVSQEHRGVSAAMNAGLDAAHGRYIARLDSDDLWLPDMLAVQVSVLEARPDIGVVYGKAQGMEHDGTPHHSTWGIPQRYPDDSLRSMVHGDFTCNITVVARRECFVCAGPYDESLGANEDWDMWLRVARHFQFACTDRVVARFRWHDDNLTHPRSPFFIESLDGRVRVLDKFFGAANLPPDIRALRPVAYQNLHIGTGLRWLGLRQYRRALGSFWSAVRARGNPPVTLVRIAWFVVSWEVLGRRPWGRRFVEWQAALRRRWRERTPAPARGRS